MHHNLVCTATAIWRTYVDDLCFHLEEVISTIYEHVCARLIPTFHLRLRATRRASQEHMNMQNYCMCTSSAYIVICNEFSFPSTLLYCVTNMLEHYVNLDNRLLPVGKSPSHQQLPPNGVAHIAAPVSRFAHWKLHLHIPICANLSSLYPMMTRNTEFGSPCPAYALPFTPSWK